MAQICDALRPNRLPRADGHRPPPSGLAPQDGLEKVLDLAALLYRSGGGSLLAQSSGDAEDSSSSNGSNGSGSSSSSSSSSDYYAGVPVLALLLEGCLWPCFAHVAAGRLGDGENGGGHPFHPLGASADLASDGSVRAELGVAVALAALGPAPRMAALVACLHLDSAHAVLQVRACA
jgi:hypothetical protein